MSSVSTEDWRPDLEIGTGAEEHLLFDVGEVRAGLTRFAETEDLVVWTLPAREIFMVLEGKARIEIADGPTLELEPGDIASLPEGAETTWHLTTPFKELWVLA